DPDDGFARRIAEAAAQPVVRGPAAGTGVHPVPALGLRTVIALRAVSARSGLRRHLAATRLLTRLLRRNDLPGGFLALLDLVGVLALRLLINELATLVDGLIDLVRILGRSLLTLADQALQGVQQTHMSYVLPCAVVEVFTRYLSTTTARTAGHRDPDAPPASERPRWCPPPARPSPSAAPAPTTRGRRD